MPPRLDAKSSSRRLAVVAPLTWVNRVNEYRRRHPDLPSISAAIRRLVEIALDSEAGRKG